jgi:transcriptional regulator with XRE-family HTH domain
MQQRRSGITSDVMASFPMRRYRRSMIGATRPVADLLREWRQRRRLSQLDLACDAEISTKHLSYLETGRARPSREMLLKLAERLEVPLRERNALLLAAGYAPMFAERSLDDPALSAARTAVDLVVRGHEPYPAFAIDGHWTLVAANKAVLALFAGVARALLQPPVNLLRLSLHPTGLAPRIVNLPAWRTHLLERLRRQINVSADPFLVDLMQELRAYPAQSDTNDGVASAQVDYAGVVTPFQLRTERGVLAFFSTTTTFGTPVDITLAELALECLYPADGATTAALMEAAATPQTDPTPS